MTQNKNKVINLHEPHFKGNELKYLEDCIKSTWVSTSGKYINKFENKIAKFTRVNHSIYCINGTHALQICLKVCGVSHDDEVIVPTLTFVAPINAVCYNNAKPVFMDCDDNYNIDQSKTISFIKEKTVYKNGQTINIKTKKVIKAIIIVHVFGNAANIDDLVNICRKRNIKIIEDASESLGTIYKHKKVHTGTIGDLGVISFNGNKIITSGGGGMIITNNDELNERIRYLIFQAKDDSFNYVHDEVGYNFAQTNISAAIGLAQIEKIKGILKKKKKIYHEYLKLFQNNKNAYISKVPLISDNNHWLNLIRVNQNKKNHFIKKFISKRINVRPVWYPNHLQKSFQKCQTYNIRNALKLHKESICLPSSYHLAKSDLKRIVSVLND